MSTQPPPAPTASAAGPCPTLIQISRTPRHWKFTQHHRTTRPPRACKEQAKCCFFSFFILHRFCLWFQHLYSFLNNRKSGLLVGCFGLNGPWKQFFNLYRPSARGREKEQRNENIQTTPTAPTVSEVGPCLLVSKLVGRPDTGS